MSSTLFYSNEGKGQQCCYNEEGNLIVGPPNGGSLDRVHIEAEIPGLSHFFHDLVPYWDCCITAPHNCAKYFEKRPSNDGSSYEPPRPGKKVLHAVCNDDDNGHDNGDDDDEINDYIVICNPW